MATSAPGQFPIANDGRFASPLDPELRIGFQIERVRAADEGDLLVAPTSQDGGNLSGLPEWPSLDPPGGFPIGIKWEITEWRAARWADHDFRGLRGNTSSFRQMGALDNSEFAVFLWDLSCHAGMLRRHLAAPDRYDAPPPLHRYLGIERERWGMVATLLREQGWVPEEELWQQECREQEAAVRLVGLVGAGT